MYVMHVSEDDLPKTYENRIVENNDKCVIIRSNLKSIQEINDWVTAFGNITHTKWNSRHSRPEGTRFFCRKNYVCHRSQFNKTKDENRKIRSKKSDQKTRTKDANCEATLRVKIKLNNSNTRYHDPFLKIGLSTIICIQKVHSHSLKTSECVELLPAKEGLKAKFFMYFENGMGIAESCKYHRRILELQGKSDLELLSSRLNPSQRTVRHFRDAWRKLNGENFQVNLFQELEEKQIEYTTQGITMLFNETPFSLAVVTPLMQRTHELKSSQSIAFIDSNTAINAENYCVTFISTACPAGISPLGIIITKGQTYESYQEGFKLLNTAVENSFCGQGFPNIIVSDNSQEIVKAVKSVWPNSRNFYSVFHVCQIVWKWLHDTKNCIPKDETSNLILAFQRILFSNTAEEASNAFQDLYLSATPYPNFQKYISDYWNIKEQWCLAWQVEAVQRLYMNQFPELYVYLFRDIALSKVMHKIVPLIDFWCTVLDDYYCRKFQEFACDRTSSVRIFFNPLLDHITYLEAKDIVHTGDIFYVPSNNKNDINIVIPSIAVCSCLPVCNGELCEHLCAVYAFFYLVTENSSPITVEDRYNVGLLAMGEEIPLNYFHHPQMLVNNDQEISSSENSLDHFKNISYESISFTVASDETSVSRDKYSCNIEELLDMMEDCHNKFGSSSTAVAKVINTLQEIKSAEQWEAFLHTFGSNVPLRGER